LPADDFRSTAAYSDTAAAGQLVRHPRYAGKIRFCKDLGGWLVWRDGRWTPDETRLVAWWATKVTNDYAAQANTDSSLTDREAKAIVSRLCSAGAKEAVLSCAQVRPGIPAAHADFDADPMVINTPDGLISLATGEVVRGAARPLVTKQTAVSPAAGGHPLWSAFLAEATAGDVDLQRYLQLLAGYCLTGLTREQILVFLWGPGGNGKSVFLSTLSGIMGDYAVGSQPEVFATSKNDRHPTEVARMRGARLVSAPESQEGRAIDEAKVKQLTGGDKVSARFMQQDFFQFTPQFKLLLVGNHKPTIRNLDAAMRRRLHLVPFTQQPKVVDRMLGDKLKAEWPQILRWAMEGCAAWQREGLVAPPVVLAQTAEYFEEEDPIVSFLEEKCVVKDGLTCRSHDLFNAWSTWAHDRNEPVGTQKGFVQKILGKPGIEKCREPITGLRALRGLELIYQEGEFEAQPAPERARA
jgi:putative DNA primase/helicase